MFRVSALRPAPWLLAQEEHFNALCKVKLSLNESCSGAQFLILRARVGLRIFSAMSCRAPRPSKLGRITCSCTADHSKLNNYLQGAQAWVATFREVVSSDCHLPFKESQSLSRYQRENHGLRYGIPSIFRNHSSGIRTDLRGNQRSTY